MGGEGGQGQRRTHGVHDEEVALLQQNLHPGAEVEHRTQTLLHPAPDTVCAMPARHTPVLKQAGHSAAAAESGAHSGLQISPTSCGGIERIISLTRRKHSGRIMMAPPPGCTSHSAIMLW